MDARLNDFPEVGKRLKTYRLAAGYTAETLAAAVSKKFPDSGVSRQLVFNIENGRRRMDLSSLIEIARTINVNPLSILCDLDRPFMRIESGSLSGLTPMGVCRLFGANGFSLCAKEGAPDARQIQVVRTAIELTNQVDSVKEIVEREDPEGSDTGLLFSWVSKTNLLNALGVELPDAMKDIDSKARKIVPPSHYIFHG